MRLKFAIPMALATACLPFAGNAAASVVSINIAETGDAGDLPATAQVLTGLAGVTYTTITGTTTATNEVYDADMFQITLASVASFTASTTAFVAGANDFDSQLFLFNSSGVGIAANDDAASGGDQSSLTVSGPLNGTYYLLIDGSGHYPVDSTGKLIFPNFTDGKTDPSATVAAQSTLPITGYTGNSNEGGKYSIALSVIPAAVPEPGTWAFVAAGVAALSVGGKFRRRAVK